MRVSPSPRYSKEEFARRGNEIYERDVQPRVTAQDDGKFVAIDIEKGAYAIDADEITAAHQLLAQDLDAQIWFRMIGSPYTHRFGPRNRTAA